MRFPAVGLALAAALVAGLTAGCDYVVVPPEASGATDVSSEGWGAVPMAIGPGDAGALRIDLAIVNRTGTWSAMAAIPEAPATLAGGGDGATVECATVVVGTGGHRLAPGFQMRGFIGGTKQEPTVETIRVECAATEPPEGGTLTIPYRYVTGEYDYYDPEATQADAELEVDLATLSPDLVFPIATPVDGLVLPPDTALTGINDVVLTLTGVDRAADVLTSSWMTENPGEYPSSVHIGEPPVIGSDGVVYGFYESPDLASVPITPAGESAEWTTEVDVPDAVDGLVMLLSVESRKARTFVNYALDLSAD